MVGTCVKIVTGIHKILKFEQNHVDFELTNRKDTRFPPHKYQL